MYKLGKLNLIIRLSDQARIPRDDKNRDYQEFKEWVLGGNAPEPEDVDPPYVPQVVSRFQLKEALIDAGLFTEANNAVARPQVPARAKRVWSDAPTFKRTSPLLASLANYLGWTDEQLDALFVAAELIDE